MQRTQIYLTDKEMTAVRSIARRLGKTQSEVIRTALDRFIDRENTSSRINAAQAKSMMIEKPVQMMASLVGRLSIRSSCGQLLVYVISSPGRLVDAAHDDQNINDAN